MEFCVREGCDQPVSSHTNRRSTLCLTHKVLAGQNRKLPSGRDRNREKVRARDNHTCQDCGKVWKPGQRRFDVHHLDGVCGEKSRGYDRLDELDRLITLCHECHFNRSDHTFGGVDNSDLAELHDTSYNPSKH